VIERDEDLHRVSSRGGYTGGTGPNPSPTIGGV
jgi:hypothetical protein